MEGHRFAFGSTEEAMRRKVYGLKERGEPGDPPLNRLTGHGRVLACDGDYADAISKGHGVLLLMTESTGALAKPVVMLLRSLARLATLPSGNDTTVYGSSRASPKAFFPHHVASISAAIAHAESETILAKAAHETFMLSLGVAPARPHSLPLADPNVLS